MSLCIGLVKYKSRYGRPRTGLCSQYIQTLKPMDPVYTFIQSGAYKSVYDKYSNSNPVSTVLSIPSRDLQLPRTMLPVLMIGPGTGIAPMRAVLQERVRAYSSIHSVTIASSDAAEYHTLVFYGCRKYQEDCVYKSEWLLHSNDIPAAARVGQVDSVDGIPHSHSGVFVSVAFSQEDPVMQLQGLINTSSGTIASTTSTQGTSIPARVSKLSMQSKVYVTTKLKQSHERVWGVIRRGGIIFVAGSAKQMPKDVRNALVEVIQMHLVGSGDTNTNKVGTTVLGIVGVNNGIMNEDPVTPVYTCTREEALQYFQANFEKTNKYIVEAWS